MKNTTSNTPKHCHDCHAFADCRQAQNMSADTTPVEGWVSDGDVYCEDCMGIPSPDDSPYDGESDSPTHCGGCGVPIIHELTADGVEYVREALADNDGGCCRELWRTVWADYDVEPPIPVDSIVIPDRFVAVCAGWYNGMGDLLYAVSSTGNLTTGTLRPRGCDSDEQWYLTLWRELSSDVGRARSAAEKGYNGPSDSEDAAVLSEFEDWVDEQIERLEGSYRLEDWEAEY